MVPFRVSCLLQLPEQLEPYSPQLELHGANLLVQSILEKLISDPRTEAFEFFLPPAEFQRKEKLAQIAAAILPKSRQGKGVLRFYALHDLPEVWRDLTPRILLCLDHEFLARDRYLRDRYALGPIAIMCQSHGLGAMSQHTELNKVAGAEPVSFDSILALAEASKDSLRRVFQGYLAPGKPLPCRIDVMPNPIDADQFRPVSKEQKREYRRLLGLPLEGTISLYLGRLTPNSKADLLPSIRIFGAMAGRNDFLLIAGAENLQGYANRLRAAAKEAHLEGRFLLQTTVEPWTRPMLYGASDVFLFPSDNAQESFGNTALEAAACGVPSIVSDWAALRETVVNGVTGFVIPTYTMPGLDRVEGLSPAAGFMTNLLLLAQTTHLDSSVLREKWSQLLKSEELRESMGAAARERVVSEYATPHFLDRFFSLAEALRMGASQESQVSRESRRGRANCIGLPAPFGHLYGNYGSRDFDLERDRVRLSEIGMKVADGKSEIRFYDETLPLIRQPIVDAIFVELKKSPNEWLSFVSLILAIGPRVPGDEGDIRWHLAVLLKREVLDFWPRDFDPGS